MAVAGHLATIYLKSTAAAWAAGDEVDGIKSVGYAPTREMLDITDTKDTTGARKKLAGLKDGSVSLSGNSEHADVVQTLLRTSFDGGASIWANVVNNPTGGAAAKGYQVECLVESYNIEWQVDGTVDFSATLQFNGAPVAI